MRIFIAWSGVGSGMVAEALRDWLPKILLPLEPFVSMKDIEPGSRWQQEIGKKLETTDYGLLCLTPDNLLSTWIHFEAGALAKKLDSSRVVPLYLGVRSTDVRDPLAQFQGRRLDAEDMFTLVQALNSGLEPRLSDAAIRESFDLWWPKLESSIQRAMSVATAAPSATGPKRLAEDIAAETLEVVRATSRELAKIGAQLAAAANITIVPNSGLFRIGPEGLDQSQTPLSLLAATATARSGGSATLNVRTATGGVPLARAGTSPEGISTTPPDAGATGPQGKK
jgi:hypothetical protein